MPHIFIRHRVNDYDQWKEAYDDHRSKREEAGLSEVNLWRNEEDPSEIVILMEASDSQKAREFAESDDLKEKMQEAGVQGRPDIMFLQ